MLKLRSDSVNEERMQRTNIIGSFCGQPIITIDEINAEKDEDKELLRRLEFSSHTSIPAEILPGEERCADGIIRRMTTAESIGYDKFHEPEVMEQAGLKRGGIEQGEHASKAGRMVYWRPNRATTEVYTVGTPLPCMKSEPEAYVLIESEGD